MQSLLVLIFLNTPLLSIIFPERELILPRLDSYEPSPTPTPTINISDTSTWNIYTNNKYKYQIKYSNTMKYTENNINDYGYTDFLAGCFKVFVIPLGFNNTDLQKSTGIPWTKLNELETAEAGSTTEYQVNGWQMGDNKKFILKYYYKKLPNKQIGEANWYIFEVANNWENHGNNNIYLLNKNTYRYLIDMRNYGPCYDDEPIRMLSTFKFTN